jgi:hypothetical protein
MRPFVPCIYLKAFLISFQWSIPGFFRYLPSIPVKKAKSRRVHTWAYIRLSTAEAYETDFIWLISYWFLGLWKLPYLSPLTIGADIGLYACILNFFGTFYKYAFCDNPNAPFLLSQWISILRTNDASPRSIISKLEDKNLLVSSSRLTSLLASRISSTYMIRKINFPFLNFA